jgi:nitrogen fixation protein NifB
MIYLDRVMAARKNISVVGIAGPGDPFANPDETLSTLEMVKQKYPDMLLCLASNGLNLPAYIDDIARLKVSHVSITINAIDPDIGKKIYSWVRVGKKSLGPEKGAAILLERQMESVRGLKEKGVIVKINSIVLPGINDHHITAVAEKMAEMNVDLFNCMPYYPNKGSNFSDLGEPSKDRITAIQKEARKHIPQMLHCKRCRADAVGLLGEIVPDQALMDSLKACAADTTPEPIEISSPAGISSPYVAVATREGMLVNQHLGEAMELSIYDISTPVPSLVEKRALPEPGGMDFRWHALADKIKDCHLLLVSGVGDSPRRVLNERGIEILMVNGLIDEVLNGVKHNLNINHLLKREPFRCDQEECSGAGMGCM